MLDLSASFPGIQFHSPVAQHQILDSLNPLISNVKDLLCPQVGELCGASEREERYDVLMNRIKELGLNEKDYWWFLNLRRFGSVKHSGFGMGFDRFIMYVTGMTNIRDVLPFPKNTKEL